MILGSQLNVLGLGTLSAGGWCSTNAQLRSGSCGRAEPSVGRRCQVPQGTSWGLTKLISSWLPAGLGCEPAGQMFPSAALRSLFWISKPAIAPCSEQVTLCPFWDTYMWELSKDFCEWVLKAALKHHFSSCKELLRCTEYPIWVIFPLFIEAALGTSFLY